jgi:hypothetical protein
MAHYHAGNIRYNSEPDEFSPRPHTPLLQSILISLCKLYLCLWSGHFRLGFSIILILILSHAHLAPISQSTYSVYSTTSCYNGEPDLREEEYKEKDWIKEVDDRLYWLH